MEIRYSRSIVFAVLAATVALGLACRSETSSLEAVTVSPTAEPCVALPGSDIDPCEFRDDYWDLQRGLYLSYLPSSIPETPFNMYNELNRLASICYNGYCQTQFFVRATVVPGSIRCGKKNTSVTNNNDGSLAVTGPTDFVSKNNWNCFVDVIVHEYINGS